MIKRIFINLVLIIIALVAIEFFCLFLTEKENKAFKAKADRLEANFTRSYKTQYKILAPYNTVVYRKSFIKENAKKKPIIWFGCSFAEGAGLEDNQTPCYKISKLTGRSCINRAKGATGTQFMYYQLIQDDFKENAPEADYIIYTFIWNHLRRLYNYQINPLIYMFNLRYAYVNGHLEEIKPAFPPIYSLYSVKRILNRKVDKQHGQEQYDFKLFNAIMKESLRLTKEKYPNSNFIMLEFPELNSNCLPAYEIKELEDYGIKVIRIKDIPGAKNIQDSKYWLSDEIHPSEAAWDIVIPYLVKNYIK